jgi:hypothetical protein
MSDKNIRKSPNQDVQDDTRDRFSYLFLINGIFNNLLRNEEGVAIKSSNPDPIVNKFTIDNFRKVNALMNSGSYGSLTITTDNDVDASIIDDKNFYYDIYLEIDLSLNEDSKQEFVSLLDSIDNFNENGKYYVKLSECELSRSSTIGMSFNFVCINKQNKDLLKKFNSIDRYIKIFLEHKKYGNPLPPFTDIHTPIFLTNINCIVVKTYERVPQSLDSPRYAPLSPQYAPDSPPYAPLSPFKSKRSPKKVINKSNAKKSPKKVIKESNTKKSSKKTVRKSNAKKNPKKVVKKSNTKKTPKKVVKKSNTKKSIKKSNAKKTPKKIVKKSNTKKSPKKSSKKTIKKI